MSCTRTEPRARTEGETVRHEFHKAGYRVALLARNADKLQKLADDINQAGGEVHLVLVPRRRR